MIPIGLVAGAVILLAVQGCGGPSRYTRALEESPERGVRLEARYGHGQSHGYDSASMPFNHPAAFSRAEVEAILKGIRVQLRKGLLTIRDSESGPKEAFTESERRALAPVLVEAFAKARPDEWVVFFLSHPRGREAVHRGGPGVIEVTSGGFFVEERQLHLALANYRSAVSMPSILDQLRSDPLRPVGAAFYELVPGAHQTLRQLDWIKTKLDLSKPLHASLSELAIDYRAAVALPDEPGPAPQAQASIEEGLRTLEGLRAQGLITEEEYRLKRQRLLDQL